MRTTGWKPMLGAALLTLALGAQAGQDTDDSATGMTAADEAQARQYFTDNTVLDQDGRELRFYSDVLRGRKVLINFIFTNCDVACPAATAKLNHVRKSLGERFGEEVFFVSISIDPENDDPAALKAFAQKHGADRPGWIFLTGRPDQVLTIVDRFGQSTDEAQMHSTMMIAGNVPRKHWIKIPPYAGPPQIAVKLDALGIRMLGGG